MIDNLAKEIKIYCCDCGKRLLANYINHDVLIVEGWGRSTKKETECIHEHVCEKCHDIYNKSVQIDQKARRFPSLKKL